ncbi:MAG: DUF4397 domain-containing protein [Acidimicrobiales bacterium]
MNEQSETERSSTNEHWFGHDRLRLTEGDNAIDVTVGSETHWDRSHLRRLRQSGDLPGMVPIIDSDFSADGKPFAVTPVIIAPTLASRVAAGDLEWEAGAAIAEAAARATHEAHLRGLFHGGLNPDDVYVIDDDVAISGVGLGLGGTPPPERLPWVAPEVRDGVEPTERSDVYSLGKVLEFSLGDSLDTVPRSIRRLIMWSSSDTPEARPPSAMEFASILAEGLGEDRQTFGPAFIPTADTADLASQASSAVSNHTPSETAQSTANAAGAGLFAAGAAAVGGGALIGDREPEALDDGVFASDATFDHDTVEVDPGVDLDDGIEVEPQPVTAFDSSAGDQDDVAIEVPPGSGEIDDGPPEVAVGHATAAPQYAAPYTERADATAAAAQTVDLDESYVPDKRRNRAGLLIGAALLAGLGLIAWGLLTSGDEEDVAAGGGDSTAATIEEATASTASSTDEDTGASTDSETATPTTSEAATTSEAPSTTEAATTAAPPTTSPPTTATPTTDAIETVDEATLVPMADGPIAASEAGIQLLHGIPGAEVDVYVNGTAIATGFEAGTIAGPIAMAPGDYEVALYASTDLPPADMADRSDEALFTQTVPVGGSAASVVAHLSADGDVAISPFLEQLSAVDPGQGRLMIRHLMATGDAEATVNGEVVGSLAPGEEAAIEVDAGPIEVEIIGSDGAALASASIAVDDGELVALSAIGAPGSSAELVVQRYSGLATAPAAVPTGNSGLLDVGSDELGIRLSYGLMVIFVLSGAVLVFRRRRAIH